MIGSNGSKKTVDAWIGCRVQSLDVERCWDQMAAKKKWMRGSDVVCNLSMWRDAGIKWQQRQWMRGSDVVCNLSMWRDAGIKWQQSQWMRGSDVVCDLYGGDKGGSSGNKIMHGSGAYVTTATNSRLNY